VTDTLPILVAIMLTAAFVAPIFYGGGRRHERERWERHINERSRQERG
jgi:hypothetical protein